MQQKTIFLRSILYDLQFCEVCGIIYNSFIQLFLWGLSSILYDVHVHYKARYLKNLH